MDIDYKEQIKLLVKLQEHDSLIFNLESEKEKKPVELEEWKNKIEEKKEELKELEDKIKKAKLEARDKELGLKSEEGEIKKLQLQLYQVKTNKEYRSLLQEIEGKKADNSLIEDQILEKMEEIDNLELELNRKRDELKKTESEFKREENRINNEIKEIEEKIKEEEKKREESANLVKENILNVYERLLKSKGGLAIVSVKGGACQGCHLSLPPQIINEIKMHNKLVTCDRCMRILYIDE
jgi:hypothetical protein